MAQSRPLRQHLTGAVPVWLLTIEWRGKTYRWSTQPITVTDADGTEYPYGGGLPEVPDLEQSLTRASANGGSVPLRVDFGEDLIALYADGYRLSTATGHLDMVTTRNHSTAVQTWQQRYRLLSGRVTLPQSAARGDLAGVARFSLEQTLSQDRGRILPPQAVINSSTWASPPDDSVGKVYPLAIGRVGNYRSGGSSQTTSGSPAYPVAATAGSNDTVLCGYGHWSATQAILFYDGGNVTLTATKGHDLLGTPCMTMDVSGQSSAVRTSGWYYIGISSDAGYKLPYPGSDHRGAGDWLRWMVGRSTLDIDRGSWAAVAPALNSFAKVATVIVDPDVAPSEWLFDNALDLLPVALVMGPDGLGAVLDEIEYRPDGARPIIEGPEFRYEGPLEEKRDPVDLVQSYTIRYAKRVRTKDYKLSTTIAARPKGSGADAARSLSVVNAEQAGATAFKVEDTDILYDPTSARRVATYRAQKLSEQPVWARFSAANHFGDLMPGDPISLTWSDKGVTDAVGRIETKSRADHRWWYLVKFPLGIEGWRA